jgi:hypothetical protein
VLIASIFSPISLESVAEIFPNSIKIFSTCEAALSNFSQDSSLTYGSPLLKTSCTSTIARVGKFLSSSIFSLAISALLFSYSEISLVFSTSVTSGAFFSSVSFFDTELSLEQ